MSQWPKQLLNHKNPLAQLRRSRLPRLQQSRLNRQPSRNYETSWKRPGNHSRTASDAWSISKRYRRKSRPRKREKILSRAFSAIGVFWFDFLFSFQPPRKRPKQVDLRSMVASPSRWWPCLRKLRSSEYQSSEMSRN